MARSLLPLDATGPAKALGVGPDWRAHAALDWTLQALRDHGGVGPDLVLLELSSPAVRNRNMSLKVLEEWPRATWTPGAVELAEHLTVGDPNEKTRELTSQVLTGESDRASG